jgi:radical SAM protein with 4Fe4S-binding SPASM domain
MIRYTELKSTKRQNLRDVIPLAKPFTVLIEPSSLCDFRCVQCFQRLEGESYFTRTRGTMPLARFEKIVGDLKAWSGPKLKVLKLNLYGEPLVNRDFSKMLRLAREAELAERIETTSNASLLTPETAEAMVSSGLDYLRVSIYAPEQRLHEEITGSKMDIRRIHENLRVLKEAKRRLSSERPFVSAKMLDMYDERLHALFKEMYSDVADELYIDKPHSWIKVEGSDFLGSYYKDALPKAEEDFKRNSKPGRVACPMPFTTMAVRANGDVAPCCVDFIGGTNLGNVDAASMEEIWNSDAWFGFQVMQLENRKRENSSCARCDVYMSEHYTRDDIDGVPVERISGKRRGA